MKIQDKEKGLENTVIGGIEKGKRLENTSSLEKCQKTFQQ